MKNLSFMILTLSVSTASFAADKPNPFAGLPLKPRAHHQTPITPLTPITPIASLPSIAPIVPLRNYDLKDLNVIHPTLSPQELIAVKYVLNEASFADTSLLPLGTFASKDILLSDGGKLAYSYSFNTGDSKPQFHRYYEKNTSSSHKKQKVKHPKFRIK